MKLFAMVLGISAILGLILPSLSAPRELIIKNAYGVSGFSSDGKSVYTYIMEDGIRSYNMLTGNLTKTLKLPQELKGKAMGSVQFLKNKDYYLNNPDYSESLHMIDARTGKLVWTYTPTWKLGSAFRKYVNISSDKNLIAITPVAPEYYSIDVVMEHGELDLIDLKSGKPIIKTLLKADYKNTAQEYPATDLKELSCDGIVFTPDSKQIIYADSSYMNFVDVKTLKIVKTVTLKGGMSQGILLNPKFDTMIASYISNEVDEITRKAVQYPAIYDWRNGKLIRVFKTQKNWTPIHRFSPDGRLVLIGSKNEDSTTRGSLWLWDVQTGKKIREFPNFELSSGVEFSPDSSRIAYGGSNDTIRVWQIR